MKQDNYIQENLEEKLHNILAKENFIIEQHHECHNSNLNGDCESCNREDTIKEIKQLLTQTIKDTEAKVKKELREEVENINKPSLKKCLMGINKALEDDTFMNGYNQALQDIINLLK